MAVSISPIISFTAIETLDTGVDGATEPQVSHEGFNLAGRRLNATSTPPATKCSYRTYTLTAGAATIDLTALLGVGDESQDCTGLKLQTILVEVPAANTAGINVAVGASNGYALFGASNDVTVPPGGWLAMFFDDELPDVSGTVKTIDLAGSGVETVNVGLVLG